MRLANFGFSVLEFERTNFTDGHFQTFNEQGRPNPDSNSVRTVFRGAFRGDRGTGRDWGTRNPGTRSDPSP